MAYVRITYRAYQTSIFLNPSQVYSESLMVRPGEMPFLNWSVVDLQYCVNFWCTVKWISYTYILSTFFLDSFPIWVITEYWVEFPVWYNKPLLAICFIYGSMYVSIPTSKFIPPPLFQTSTKLMQTWLKHLSSSSSIYNAG